MVKFEKGTKVKVKMNAIDLYGKKYESWEGIVVNLINYNSKKWYLILNGKISHYFKEEDIYEV